jgi:hypothetical protein
MAYHAALDRTIMFGGMTASGASDLTYEWDGTDWQLLTPGIKPSARFASCMTYDSDRERLVLFGGFPSLADTWEWNGSYWQDVTPLFGISPPGHFGYQISYDTVRRRTVLFGDDGTTWEWNGGTWTQRTPVTTSPSGRSSGSMAYDSVREQTMLWGGVNSGTKPNTWVYGPTHPAVSYPFGSGCAGSVGTPTLRVENDVRPWLGKLITLTMEPVPQPEIGLIWIGSKTSWLGAPLPTPLDSLGMPGCQLLVGLNSSGFIIGALGHLGMSFLVPTTPSLLGVETHWQGAAFDAPANAFGMVTSQALTLVLGGQ